MEKRAVVKDEIVVSKDRVTDTERVETEVRKEHFDVSGDTELLNENVDPSRRRR